MQIHRLKAVSILIILLTIAGCGGRMSSHDYGRASLTVEWPETSRVSPTIQSIRIDVSDGDTTLTSRIIDRTSQESRLSTVLNALPAGNFLLTITAYPLTQAQGTPVAQAATTLAIDAGGHTSLVFEVLGSVHQIELSPSNSSIKVHGYTRLAAMPINSDGKIVLLTPGSLNWTSSDPSVALVDETGLVTGVAAGTTAIHVTDSGSGAVAVAELTVRQALWTVMVYMAADNNLEPYAIKDINQLEMVGSTSEMSIVVQVDRAEGYDRSNGDWTTTRRYYITRDTDTAIINSSLIEDLGELDMADPDNLTDFVNWATDEYPAERYLLVLWDHGMGWRTHNMTLGRVQREVRAIFVDETFNSCMSLAQLSTAFDRMNARMDIVLFDACLMGMIEVAYAIRDSADIMIASEENIPVDGQPYHLTVSRLASNPYMSHYQLSRIAIDEYMDYYSTGYAGTFTYSAIDLPSLGNVVSATDQLATAILANPQIYPAARTAQQQTQHYDFDKRYYTDYKDIYDFARRLNELVNVPMVNNAASDVMSAVNSTVLYERNNGGRVENSYGISIYLPDSGTMLPQYRNIDFARDTRWDEFLMIY